MCDLRGWTKRKTRNRWLKANRAPIVHKVGDINAPQTGGEIVTSIRTVTGKNAILVAADIRHTVGAACQARHGDRSAGDIIKNAGA